MAAAPGSFTGDTYVPAFFNVVQVPPRIGYALKLPQLRARRPQGFPARELADEPEVEPGA